MWFVEDTFADDGCIGWGCAGGAIQGQEPTPGPGGGSGNGEHLRWIYFRIKDDADEYLDKPGAWKIDGVDVSGCKMTEGLYFAFQANNASTTLKNHMSTMPYNAWTCHHNCNWGCCVVEWITKTDHSGTALAVDTSIYNTNVFEPEYILQVPQGGVSHTTPAVKDYNGNGTIDKNWIFYDKPNDVLLYIVDQWEKNIRTRYFEGNQYYYDPSKPETASKWSNNCKDPNGNWSENACRILAYDWPNGYSYDGNTHLSNYRAGNHGWKRNGAPDEYNKQNLSNVNVTYFCAGAANGEYEGAVDGKVKQGATEVPDLQVYDSNTKTTTKYYDGTNDDGKYRVVFTHTITRTDNDSNRLMPAQKSRIRTDYDSNTDEEIVSRLHPQGTNQIERYVDVEVEQGSSKTVCQTLTYETKYINGQPASGATDSITVCVVISQPIKLTTASRSYVSNSINNNYNDPANTGETKTVSSWGGSKGDSKTYTYSFTHQLALNGKAGYAYDIEYYITQTNNGNPESVTNGGSSSSPKTARINSSENNSFTVVSPTTSKNWDPIGPGGKTPTICQTIYFKPKEISTTASGSSARVTDSSWQSSTACTYVQRRMYNRISIDATSDVYVNGVKNPSTTSYSIRAHELKFVFNINTPNNRSLNTTYTIERITYGAGGSENWANATVAKGPTNVTAPVSGITDTFTIQPEEGKSKTVCERIKLNPDKYQIEYNGDGSEEGVYGMQSSGAYAKRCTTVAWPAKTWRNDGEITVYTESSGKLVNESETGGYRSDLDAFLIKKESASITYTHKLWREAEKHTGDGVHQAVVKTPEEDVNVKYRFSDPGTTFADETAITTTNGAGALPSLTVKTNYSVNGKVSDTSNTTDSLKNANTTARAPKVGRKYTYCQANNYISKTYDLRGQYWEVDGEIYSGSPEILAVDTPKPRKDIGKSNPPGCVNIIRPYNFNISKITITSSEDEPATYGGDVHVSFNINVDKNSDYMITDVPNAKIQVIKFILTDAPDNGTTAGGSNINDTPCTYFRNKIGAGKMTTCDDTSVSENKTIADGRVIDGEGTSYYNKDHYEAPYNYDTTLLDDHLPITAKVCFAIGIQPTNSGSNGYGVNSNEFSNKWTISDATCVNIGKHPMVQIWGGSTFTSGGIVTSTTVTTRNNVKLTYGSWDDYMLIANGQIDSMASGAAYISGLANPTTCKISSLTIANDKCNATDKEIGKSGVYSSYSLIDSIYDYYIKDRDKYTDISTSNRVEGKSHYINTEVLNEASGNYPIIIYNHDNNYPDVYIKSDINIGYSTRKYKDINIPQVIIYTRGNVYIDPAVTHLDAWILAKGDVMTCADGDGENVRNINVERCGNKLTITGPIVTNKIWFDRTANGDAYIDENGNSTIAESAELLDFSPAIYLFGYNETSNDSQPLTTYLHKLPPRY
ncbi:hypothetical protein IK146_03780 [Candidatus Saccharibacteria bacterium]|nr:hypothetical protein [Candidatus Saccharibacteria bacterium]